MSLPSVRIAGRTLGAEEPCFVIAEAGSNFNGDFETAKLLIDIAAEAKADAVKFQTFKGDSIYMPGSPMTENLEGKTKFTDLRDLLSDLAMPREWIPDLAHYADTKGILFLSTPFDLDAVDVLDPHVSAFKIAAFELVHYPLIRKAARTGKPIILSTGMSNLAEVEKAIEVVRDEGLEEIVLLQTVSSYPADPKETNLKAMVNMGHAFQLPIGLSDHTMTNYQAFAARAMGAVVIEKHFTFDRLAEGPDHPYALTPEGLADLVEGIRSIESALGSGIKHTMPGEVDNRKKARRSLFFARAMSPGEVVQESDLIVNRPGTGLHPRYMEIVVGMKVRESVAQNDPVTWGAL